jgi:hypothetical protein
MSEDNQSNENNKTSAYDRNLREIKERAHKNAKEDIMKLYEALKQEGLESKDAGNKIKHDLNDTYSKATIYRYLPEEARRDYEKNIEEEDTKVSTETIETEEAKKELVQVTTTGTQEPITIKDPLTMEGPDLNAKVSIPISNTTFANDKAEVVEIGPQQATNAIVLPVEVWDKARGLIIQWMRDGRKVYLVHDGKIVTDIRLKP